MKRKQVEGYGVTNKVQSTVTERRHRYHPQLHVFLNANEQEVLDAVNAAYAGLRRKVCRSVLWSAEDRQVLAAINACLRKLSKTR